MILCAQNPRSDVLKSLSVERERLRAEEQYRTPSYGMVETVHHGKCVSEIVLKVLIYFSLKDVDILCSNDEGAQLR
jgi:hypothetical protein